jgi:hypothetical protein
MSSCAARGRLDAIANRKTTTGIDSDNRRREADRTADGSLYILDSPMNFEELDELGS